MIYFILGIVIFLLVLYMLQQHCNSVQYEVFTPKSFTKTVLIIASIHGSEPAGSLASARILPYLSDSSSFDKLKQRVVLITCANPCGMKMGWRHNPYYVLKGQLTKGDMNRQYGEGGHTQINQQILSLIHRFQPSLIVDLHEAWGYFQLEEGSMGNGIYPVGNDAYRISTKLQQQLNQQIKKKEHTYVVHDWQPVPEGSLRELAKQRDWNYILIETSAEQKLQQRIHQHFTCLYSILFE